MFKIQNVWLALAAALTCGALLGAAALIALDFAGVEGLTRAWGALSASRTVEPVTPMPPATPAAPDTLAARLQGVGEIDLFVAVDVPNSPLRVQTGTSYDNARDLAAGTAAYRWCYAQRRVQPTAFHPTVTLGNQKGAEHPTLFEAAGISAEDARHLDATPEALAGLARRYCRFGA